MENKKNGEPIGHRIQLRRRELGMTQLQIAEEIGVSMAAVSLWEKDKTNISSDNLQKVANALRCNPLWLLNGSGSKFETSPQVKLYTGEEEGTELSSDEEEILRLYSLLPQNGKGKLLAYAQSLLSEHAKELEKKLAAIAEINKNTK